MSQSELGALRVKAQRKAEKIRTRVRELYRHARNLDFSSTEAAILSQTSRAKIDRLAEEKNKGG